MSKYKVHDIIKEYPWLDNTHLYEVIKVTKTFYEVQFMGKTIGVSKRAFIRKNADISSNIILHKSGIVKILKKL